MGAMMAAVYQTWGVSPSRIARIGNQRGVRRAQRNRGKTMAAEVLANELRLDLFPH